MIILAISTIAVIVGLTFIVGVLVGATITVKRRGPR